MSISLYYGDEEYLLSAEAKRLRERIINPDLGGLGNKLLENPDIGEVLEAIGAVTFSLGGQSLIEIRDFAPLHKAVSASADEKQLAELCDLLQNHDEAKHIAFISEKVNKTVKFAKWLTSPKNVQAEIREFKQPPPWKPEDAVQSVMQECRVRGLQIQPQAVNLLVENLGVGMRLLMTEIEKLSVYAADRPVTVQDVTVLSGHNENTLKMLGNWVHQRNRAEIYSTLEELFLREAPVRLFAFTQSFLGNIYQLRYWQQMGMNERDMVERTKKHPYKVKMDLQEYGRIPFARLEMLKQKTLELEYQSKTGGLEPHLAYEMLMGA